MFNLRPLEKYQNSSKNDLLDKKLIKKYNLEDMLPKIIGEQ